MQRAQKEEEHLNSKNQPRFRISLVAHVSKVWHSVTLFCFGWSGWILGRRLNAKLVHLNFEQTKNDAMKDMDAMQAWSEKFQEWANRQAWGVLLVFNVFACGKCLDAVGWVHVWIWMVCFLHLGRGSWIANI